MSLTLTPLQNIPLIRQDDNLADIIVNSLRENRIELEDNDILVLAQKIVSKAEGRMVNLEIVNPSQRAIELAEETQKDPRLIELILQESNEVLRTRAGTIIVEHKLGFVCANAGIDHSNVNPPLMLSGAVVQSKQGEGPRVMENNEWVLLLPQDSDHSSRKMREEIESKTGKTVGILIIDSHGRAWRNGTVGISGPARHSRPFWRRITHHAGRRRGRACRCRIVNDGASRRRNTGCARARIPVSIARWLA